MSRKIPIVVDPGYEANFRNRRRGSEPTTTSMSNMNKIPDEKQFMEASKRLSDRRFQRRHSEDPSANFWSSANSRASPRYEEGKVNGEGLKRRGSTPVYWNNPYGRRDRFEQIVERMMNANDDELLSGFMERDLGPLDVDEMQKNSYGPGSGTTRHEKPQRSPSADEIDVRFAHRSGNARPFVMRFKDSGKGNDGCIEIPVRMVADDERAQKISEVKCEVEADFEKDTTIDPEMKEEAPQTNGSVAENSHEPARVDENNTDSNNSTIQSDKIVNDIDQRVGNDLSKQNSENVDDAKLSHIKQIESSLKKTHEQVKSFKGTSGKNNYKEYLMLEELLMKTLMSLDAVQANGSTIVREARRAVVMQVQKSLKELEQNRSTLEQK